MTQEAARQWAFSTARLDAGERHALADQCGLDLIEVVGVVLTPATAAGLLILFETPDESAPDVVVADLAPRVCKRHPTRLCAQLTRW